MSKRIKRVIILVAVIFLVLLLVSLLVGAVGRAMLPGLGLPEWLIVPQPHPVLPAEEVFHIGSFPVTNSLITSWITIIVLALISFLVSRNLKLIPSRGQVILEYAVGGLLDFCQSVAGEKNGRRFFPVIGTIFLFVFANAWLSLIPGFGSIMVTNAEGHVIPLLRPANTDINFPLALAIISFVFVEYYGLKTLGLPYLEKFVNVKRFLAGFGQVFRGKFKQAFGNLFNGVIDIYVGILETLSEFIRIVSFTFRLFGNMIAGEILLLIGLFLVPFAPIELVYGLEMLVGFVQALVFSGLTLVFVSMAVTPHEGEEGHHS